MHISKNRIEAAIALPLSDKLCATGLMNETVEFVRKREFASDELCSFSTFGIWTVELSDLQTKNLGAKSPQSLPESKPGRSGMTAQHQIR